MNDMTGRSRTGKARPVRGPRWRHRTPRVPRHPAFHLFILCTLILWGGSIGAEEVHLIEGQGIRVLFEKPHEPVAKELLHIYPELKKELETIFAWDLNLTPSIRLIRDSRQFRQWVSSPLTVAFALPQRDLVVIDYSKLKTHPFTLRNTFKHELCHLLLHLHIQSGLLPRWLDEGIAQWASDGAVDIVLDQKRSLLHRAALKGRFIPLDSLVRRFPTGDQDLILAYEESKSFIDYLIGISGKEGVLEVLEAMKQGQEVESAVLNSYAVSLAALEREWQRDVAKRMTWFTYLSYHLYDILFALAALVTLYGFIRVMVRKRRAMKETMDDGLETETPQ